MGSSVGSGGEPADGLDAELIAYYDAEARAGIRAGHSELRRSLRASFADVLRAEGRRRLVDVGAGPGLDTRDWVADGFDAFGLDLAPANVGIMIGRGLRGVAGSLYDQPFPARSFRALWTMSTFVHVPHDRFDSAMSELVRVVEPGAPLGIGTWGGRDYEGYPDFAEIDGHVRFFSLATHERWHDMLARHGSVERFDTFQPDHSDGWEYQFAVVRTPRATVTPLP